MLQTQPRLHRVSGCLNLRRPLPDMQLLQEGTTGALPAEKSEKHPPVSEYPGQPLSQHCTRATCLMMFMTVMMHDNDDDKK